MINNTMKSNEELLALTDFVSNASNETISTIARDRLIMNLINNYLDRTTDSDREVISASLINFSLVERNRKRPRGLSTTCGSAEILHKVSRSDSERSVAIEKVVSICQDFDCRYAQKMISEWNANGSLSFSHKGILWCGPGNETEADKVRRLHTTAMLSETELGLVAIQRRLSYLFLACVFETPERDKHQASMKLLEMIHGPGWNDKPDGERKKKQLNYKIKAGRRWLQLGREFGVGIVMLPGPNFQHSLYDPPRK